MRRQIQAWADAHGRFTKPQHPVGKARFELAEAEMLLLARISLTIGEIAYNLRSALDYLVYDLATMGGGKGDYTQFPIDDRRAQFELHTTGIKTNGKYDERVHQLNGVPSWAIVLIRGLQPCEGCKWTPALRDLSNPDKHRKLTALRSRADIRIRAAGEITVDPVTGEGSYPVDVNAEVEIFLADGRPVLETVKALGDEVKATVALFKKGPGSL